MGQILPQPDLVVSCEKVKVTNDQIGSEPITYINKNVPRLS